jgi:hypothetical protein
MALQHILYLRFMKYLTFLIVLLHMVGIGQTENQPADMVHLRFSAGLSVPVLDYTSNDLSKGCFTQPGLALSALFDWRLRRQISIGLEASVFQHPVDVSSLGAAKVLNDPFLQDLYIRSDPYRLIGLFPRISYGFLLRDKVRLSVNGAVGPMWSRTPYQLYKPEYYATGPPYYEITESRDLSLAYGMGVEAAFYVHPYLNFLLSMDMKETRAAFGFLTASGIRTDHRRINFFNISAGLHLTLY